MIDISLIPHEVKVDAAKFAHITEAIKEALLSNTAISVEALINQFYPAAGPLEAELITLCNTAIATCQKIQDADWSGVTARLQRLVADCTHISTSKEHGLSKCIQWVECVIRDLLGPEVKA